jgi:anti-anti-sigma regulatory factor
MNLQSDPVVPSANPPPPRGGGILRLLSPPPMVALELQAIGIGESFKTKPSDLTALEVCHK